MKKLLGFFISFLVIYGIYYDLSVGTLPTATSSQQINTKVTTIDKPKTEIPSFDAKVKPGETVISIVEHKINKPLPVSITDLIDDFLQLNPGQTPEKIQIGTTYHFPDYSAN